MSLTSRLASLENLIARDPDDLSLRREHASCLASLAREHGDRHEFEAALARCQAAQRAHVRWCDLCRSERRTRETRDVCSGLDALREMQADLVTAWALEAGGAPHEPSWTALPEAEAAEGGAREDAVAAAEAAIALAEAAAVRHPLRAARTGLPDAVLQLGNALLASGAPGDALPLLSRSLALQRIHLEARPHDERAQRTAARTLAARAVTLLRLARWGDGLDALESAHQVLVRRIDEIRRDSAWDDLEDLAELLFELCERPSTPPEVRSRLLSQVECAAQAALRSSLICARAPGVLRRVDSERKRLCP